MKEVLKSWPMVGRDDELETLNELASNGTNLGVCLRGEAGLGKTRLARRAHDMLSDGSTRTEWLVGLSGINSFPFGALSPWLDDMSQVSDPRLLPATIRQQLIGDDVPRLVLVLDDAPLIDEASIALVTDLADQRKAKLILTCRNGESLSRDAQRLIDQGQIVEIELDPLDYSDVANLLEQVLEGPIEEYTLRQMFGLSRGNPLLLRELVVAGLRHDVLSRKGRLWRLTGTILEHETPKLIESRLASLPELNSEALTTLALAENLPLTVMEQEFGIQVISALEEEGLVDVHRDRLRHTVVVSHPLYKQAAQARITAAAGRSTYQRLVSAVRKTGARRNEDVLRLARWQLATGAIEDSDVLLSAARLANASNDHATTLELVEASMSVTDNFETRLLKGRALSGLGRWQAAEREFKKLETTSEKDEVRRAIARAENLALQAGSDRALGVLKSGLADTQDRELRNEIEATVVFVASYLGQLNRASRESHQLLARPDVNPSTRLRTLVISTYADVLMGAFDETVDARIESGLQEANEHPDQFPLAIDLLWINRAVGLGSHGELRAAEEIARERYDNALESDARGLRAVWANNVGYALLSRGQPRRALRFFLEAAEVFQEQDPVGSMFQALCLGAIAASIIGDQHTTQTLLQRHGEHLTLRGQSFGRVLRARATTWQHFAKGDLKAAADAALEAGRVAVEGDQHIHAMAALHDAVRFGYGNLVADYLNELARQVNGNLVVAMATHATAAAAQDGDTLVAAADQFSLMGADLFATEALSQASHCYRKHGRQASATQTAVRANELLEHCDGAVTPWLWLERPQGLTPRQLEVARLAASGLTDREISDRLELSVRTVSNHLASTYVKLGIHNRRELEGLVPLMSDQVR